MYVAFPGDLLLRLLQLSVLPLITASIVAAIGGVDLRLAGKLGRRAFTYYMITTVIAEIEGLLLVFLIKPGVDSSVERSAKAAAPPKRVFYLADAIMDILRNMVPPNLIEAALYSVRSLIFLVKLSTTQADLLLSLGCSGPLGWYFQFPTIRPTKLVQLSLTGAAVAACRVRNLLPFLRDHGSSATVPVTIATLEDHVELDPRVVRFMVPVGATINMDGAALYEAVSAVFLAQLHGVDMDIGRVLAVRRPTSTRNLELHFMQEPEGALRSAFRIHQNEPSLSPPQLHISNVQAGPSQASHSQEKESASPILVLLIRGLQGSP
ncbi:hypothetical protein V5799_018180 [Amblyomma americanum]|uniref:Amino acid transporter n=1 Tax=Amblyomma americanum TaxID=6943 RepID=A0AAQ4F0H4_AMBAM